MAATTFILRPSSDISIGHTLFPAESTTAYLLINEETSDEGATCISVQSEKDLSSSTTTATSSFRLSGTVPNDEVMVAEVLISCSCKYTGGSASNNGLLSVAGAALTTPINLGRGGLSSYSTTTVSAGEEVINAINNYIIANGSFPEITISIESSATGKDSEGYKSSAYGVAYISQLYLTVTYHTGIYRKIADVWKPSYQIYQKVNDAWTQITTSSAKSIMKSRLVKAGHEKIAIEGYAATCLGEGLTTGYKCSICGHVFTPQEVIPALGHSPYTIAGKAPTCGATGLTDWQQCSRCGVTLVPQEVIPATGNHSYVESGGFDEFCTVCGYINGYGHGTMSYYGTATSLSSGRYDLAATSVGNYALFGGGGDYTDGNATVDAYDQSLTRSTPTSLSSARCCLAATSVGNYALFGGGYDSNIVDVYDLSLTRTVSDPLCMSRYDLAATSVGNYALFGGGHGKAEVDAYNTSLVHTAPLYLSDDRYDLAATSIGNYALFGGGDQGIASSLNIVDAYNQSLTRSTPTPLSEARGGLAATTVGNYALFGGGGRTGSAVGDTVDAYNQSLTRSIPATLNTSFVRVMATTIGNYALFAMDNNGNDDTDVYAYNHSLTRTSLTALSSPKGYGAATIVGSYALFGGDYKKTGVVDAYQIKF